MKPQEKAKELVETYRFILLPFMAFHSGLTEGDLLRKCKQCAIVAVDEIVSNLDVAMKASIHLYWHYVKDEINKL